MIGAIAGILASRPPSNTLVGISVAIPLFLTESPNTFRDVQATTVFSLSMSESHNKFMGVNVVPFALSVSESHNKFMGVNVVSFPLSISESHSKFMASNITDFPLLLART